jgi:Ni,Fe-hydrogenase III large subunit
VENKEGQQSKLSRQNEIVLHGGFRKSYANKLAEIVENISVMTSVAEHLPHTQKMAYEKYLQKLAEDTKKYREAIQGKLHLRDL